MTVLITYAMTNGIISSSFLSYKIEEPITQEFILRALEQVAKSIKVELSIDNLPKLSPLFCQKMEVPS